MYDVVALGELLIDFIQNGRNSKGTPVFEANPGRVHSVMCLQCSLAWGIRQLS